MVDQLKNFSKQHPKIIMAMSILLVFVAVENYRQAVNWAEGADQIEASEFYGG